MSIGPIFNKPELFINLKIYKRCLEFLNGVMSFNIGPINTKPEKFQCALYDYKGLVLFIPHYKITKIVRAF